MDLLYSQDAATYEANKINFSISLSLCNVPDTAGKILSVSGSKMDWGAKFST